MNLAKLSKEEKDDMEMDKKVCLARYHCRGKSAYERNRYILTLPSNVQSRIKELKKRRLK
jgi:hypothetical protein